MKVGPIEYDVVFDSQVLDINSLRTGAGVCLGLTLHHATTIMVDDNVSEDVQASTLLHEVLHAVFDVTGVSYDIGSKTEEKLIRHLEATLLQVLRENPELVAYLVTPR